MKGHKGNNCRSPHEGPETVQSNRPDKIAQAHFVLLPSAVGKKKHQQHGSIFYNKVQLIRKPSSRPGSPKKKIFKLRYNFYF